MSIPISAYPNFQAAVPAGDNQERMVCSECDWIHYDNPKIIVTGLCVWEDHILLCRRAIGPRRGFWTLPGGFMEVGETIQEGVCREVTEEALCEVEVKSLLATYSIAGIGQVHMVHFAQMKSAACGPGEESLEVRLFPLKQDALPWDELAFPVNEWTLRDYLSLDGRQISQPFQMRDEDRHVRLSPVDCHPDYPFTETGQRSAE